MRSRLLTSVFMFFLLATTSSSSEGQQRNGAPTSTEAQVLTSLPKTVLDAELKAAGGGSFRLSDYSGNGLVVVLWATWCAPCRLQIASLVKLQGGLRAHGMEVIGLSTENAEVSAEGVREFIRDSEVNFEIGWATPEVTLSLMQGRDAIPQTFVISRSGRIVKRFVGFNPTATPPLVELAIEEAVNEKTARPKQN